MSVDILSIPATVQAGRASGAKNASGKGEGLGFTDGGESGAFSAVLSEVTGAETGDPVGPKGEVQKRDDNLPGGDGTSTGTTGKVDETAFANLLGCKELDSNPVQTQQVQQVQQVQVALNANLESDLDGGKALASKTLVENDGLLPGTTAQTNPNETAKLAEVLFREQATVAPRRDQPKSQAKVAQNDGVLSATINQLASSVSTSSPLLIKDVVPSSTADPTGLPKDADSLPNAVIATVPGLSIRQTLSRNTKEVSASPLSEVLPKVAASKAQQPTQAVQADFSATASAGRNSETLADSKKVLPKEFFSEVQSIEIRAPEAYSALMPGARWKEQPQMRSIFGREVVETVQSPQSSSLSASTGSTTAAMQLSSPTEVFVAEQVSYWISRDVQNAEMKLEGLGSDPVQVNISMNGNEAQVVFRTDELQVRNALESASAHLKEMLQQEGVVLSGVSVGSNGSGGSGTQEDKQREGGKQTSVLAAQTLQPIQRRDSLLVAGRSLDLFV